MRLRLGCRFESAHPGGGGGEGFQVNYPWCRSCFFFFLMLRGWMDHVHSCLGH